MRFGALSVQGHAVRDPTPPLSAHRRPNRVFLVPPDSGMRLLHSPFSSMPSLAILFQPRSSTCSPSRAQGRSFELAPITQFEGCPSEITAYNRREFFCHRKCALCHLWPAPKSQNPQIRSQPAATAPTPTPTPTPGPTASHPATDRQIASRLANTKSHPLQLPWPSIPAVACYHRGFLDHSRVCIQVPSASTAARHSFIGKKRCRPE